jgi:probable HAF family extracellular repeat protein
MAPLIRLVLAAGTLLLTSLTVQAVVPYRIIDLGDLPGGLEQSSASGINNAGQVVGNSAAAQLTPGGLPAGFHAFRWTAARGMQDLGTLPGPGDFSEARGINDAGHVVGLSAGTDFRAFLWTPRAGMQNLGTLPGGDFSEAFGINNAGQVVGRASAASGDRAFLWTSRGGMQDIGPGSANGLNNAGQAVGGSDDGRAFLWTARGGIRDIGPGTASDINAVGQVVGGSSDRQAFLWTAVGGMQDLGVLPGADATSAARAINDIGQVVGVAQTTTGSRAFLWTATDGIQDLNALIDPLDPLKAAIFLQSAQDINNAGQIVGAGFIDGKAHAVLLTPVPEPETWALLIVGLGLIRLFVRRRANPVT